MIPMHGEKKSPLKNFDRLYKRHAHYFEKLSSSWLLKDRIACFEKG